MNTTGDRTIRLGIQQPSLPAYRVPVFRQLAKTSGLQLHLCYGSEEPALANAQADGFDATLVPFQKLNIPSVGPLFWHSAQWSLASWRACDVAVMCWNPRYLSLWVALVRARLSGVPVALWGHGFSKQSGARWRAWLRRLPARIARAVIVYDHATADALVAEGYARERVFIAANGLDSQAIARARDREEARTVEERACWTRERSVDAGPVLLYVGRVFAESRLDVAIDALADLADSHPQARLVIIGKGSDEIRWLRTHAESRGISERLLMPGPIYDETELARWMSAADVFVYPSNVGLSLVHAFNYGLPAVVAAPLEQHNPEVRVLVDHVNGRVAETLNGPVLAMAIRDVIDDPIRHAQMRTAALESVRHTHNLLAVVNTFDALSRYLTGHQRTLIDTAP